MDDPALGSWLKGQRWDQLGLFSVAVDAGPLWMSAVTSSRCQFGHDRPAPECGCGLYAWADPDPHWYKGIRGAIACWGHIVIHGDEGFRAQHARIVAFQQPPGFMLAELTEIASELGVPIVPKKHLAMVAREYGQLLAEWHG